MNSSTSSSRQPLAWVAAAVIILAGELVFALTLPPNQGRHHVDRLLARLSTPMPKREIAYWSDSVSFRVLVETPVADTTHRLESNQAIGIPGVYFTYLRFLESTPPPRCLCLVLTPDSWSNDLTGPLAKTYFETCFLRWDEIGDYEETTERVAQSARMAMYRLLLPPSLRRRGAVTDWMNVETPLLVVPALPRVIDAEEVRALLRARAEQERFVVTRISELYVDKIVRRAAEDGTQVVLMTSALPRSITASWRATGYLAEYEAWLGRLASRHANLTVERVDRFAVFTDEDMRDEVHLNAPAKALYGRLLSDTLQPYLDR